MLKNRVKETTSTTGDGDITTTGAVAGFETFNTAFGQNKSFYYWLVNDTDDEWETGIGYLSAATTLKRETVQSSSNSDALVVFTTAPTAFCATSQHSAFSAAQPASGICITTSTMMETGSGASFNVDANEIHYWPINLMYSGSYDSFRFNVTGAGTNAIFGLYDVKAGLPHRLLASHDTDFSMTTGAKNPSFDGGAIDLVAGTYFIGMCNDGNPSFYGAPQDSYLAGILGVSDTMFPYVGLNKTLTYPASMPNPADVTSLTYELHTDEAPVIGLEAT